MENPMVPSAFLRTKDLKIVKIDQNLSKPRLKLPKTFETSFRSPSNSADSLQLSSNFLDFHCNLSIFSTPKTTQTLLNLVPNPSKITSCGPSTSLSPVTRLINPQHFYHNELSRHRARVGIQIN
jgi:hypothetical protein